MAAPPPRWRRWTSRRCSCRAGLEEAVRFSSAGLPKLQAAEAGLRDVGRQLFAALLGTGNVAGLYRTRRGARRRAPRPAPARAADRRSRAGGAALGGDVRPGRRGLRLPTGPASPTCPVASVRPRSRPTAPTHPRHGLLPAAGCRSNGRRSRCNSAGPLARPIARPSRAALGPERGLGGPADCYVTGTGTRSTSSATADYHPAGRGSPLPGGEDGQPTPWTRPADRPAAQARPAPPDGTELLLRRRGRDQDLFSGTAAALVRGGFSAVVAMQYEISGRPRRVYPRLLRRDRPQPGHRRRRPDGAGPCWGSASRPWNGSLPCCT